MKYLVEYLSIHMDMGDGLSRGCDWRTNTNLAVSMLVIDALSIIRLVLQSNVRERELTE